jgi:hypothetical protein
MKNDTTIEMVDPVFAARQAAGDTIISAHPGIVQWVAYATEQDMGDISAPCVLVRSYLVVAWRISGGQPQPITYENGTEEDPVIGTLVQFPGEPRDHLVGAGAIKVYNVNDWVADMERSIGIRRQFGRCG